MPSVFHVVLLAGLLVGCGSGNSEETDAGVGTDGDFDTSTDGNGDGDAGQAGDSDEHLATDAEGGEWDTDADAELSTDLGAGVVRTHSGPVHGTRSVGLATFLGIPYATPPIGALRWRSPEPVEPWEVPLDATAFGPVCPQIGSPVLGNVGADLVPGEHSDDCPETCVGDACCLGDEDCLTANVWTPAGSIDEGLAVMVWIHGGGWNIGSSSQLIYDGANLARGQDVVVVSFNYRLGPLGFLAHPELSTEAPYEASGNYGMLDQILLLQWVRDNVGEFGGDPDNVTIFGESAGGGSVCHLLASPLTAGLFHQAIIQSASCPAPHAMRFLDEVSPMEVDSAEALGQQAAQVLGCESDSAPLDCMRSLTAGEIYQTLKPSTGAFVEGDDWFPRLWPIVDGYFLPEATGDILEAGSHNQVPTIGGTNTNEMGLWRLIHTIPILGGEDAVALLLEGELEAAIDSIDPDALNLVVAAWFGFLYRDRVLELYPLPTNGRETVGVYERMLTDVVFVCPTRRYIRALTSSDPRTWQYSFDRVPPHEFPQDYGAVHAVDIQYALGNLDADTAVYREWLDEDDVTVSEEMMGYWARFARTGDPNGEGAVEWPAYVDGPDTYLKIDAPNEALSELQQAACNLFDEFRVERCQATGLRPLACAI